ncbi:MAG: hypothetical protein OEY49_12345 [Candidatus Heimdallarchaeota archaeon]|nr:hypothetical protein [Candidatus Heimdallarchaeota archaeon]
MQDSDLVKLVIETNDVYKSCKIISLIEEQTILQELAANNSQQIIVRQAAIKKIIDQDLLERLSIYDTEDDIRLEASKKLNSIFILSYLCLKDPNHRIREVATKLLPRSQIETLKKIATSDSHWLVRYTAVWKLDCKSTLQQISMNDVNIRVRMTAVERVNDDSVYFKLLMDTTPFDIKLISARKIQNEVCIMKCLISIKNSNIREVLVNRLNNQENLKIIAITDLNRWVRYTAIEKIIESNENSEFFYKIAITDIDENVRYSALKKINQTSIFLRIVLNSEFLDSCIAALNRISNQKDLGLLRLTAKEYLQPYITNRMQIVSDNDVNSSNQSINSSS